MIRNCGLWSFDRGETQIERDRELTSLVLGLGVFGLVDVTVTGGTIGVAGPF